MHDAVHFESAGRPAVIVISSEFADAARTQGAGLGLPEVQFVSVLHPIQGTTDEEVFRRADSIVDQLVALLTA